MTIYEIKQATQKTSPYFFERDTMKFWGQNMKSFKVAKQADGRFMIWAPTKDRSGKRIGETVRYFNPKNNELEQL